MRRLGPVLAVVTSLVLGHPAAGATRTVASSDPAGDAVVAFEGVGTPPGSPLSEPASDVRRLTATVTGRGVALSMTLAAEPSGNDRTYTMTLARTGSGCQLTVYLTPGHTRWATVTCDGRYVGDGFTLAAGTNPGGRVLRGFVPWGMFPPAVPARGSFTVTGGTYRLTLRNTPLWEPAARMGFGVNPGMDKARVEAALVLPG